MGYPVIFGGEDALSRGESPLVPTAADPGQISDESGALLDAATQAREASPMAQQRRLRGGLVAQPTHASQIFDAHGRLRAESAVQAADLVSSLGLDRVLPAQADSSDGTLLGAAARTLGAATAHRLAKDLVHDDWALVRANTVERSVRRHLATDPATAWSGARADASGRVTASFSAGRYTVVVRKAFWIALLMGVVVVPHAAIAAVHKVRV